MAEEARTHEHSSPIKTPKQLIIAVVAAFAVPVTIIVMLASYITGGIQVAPEAPERVVERIKPVGEVVVATGMPVPAVEQRTGEQNMFRAGGAEAAATQAAPAAAAAPASGEKVFATACSACHTPGVAGAPKLGDKAAWAARIAGGKDTLYTSALKGKGAMPAKGGNAGLSDADVKAAVDYMVGRAK